MEVLEQLVFLASLFHIPRKEGARRAREWLDRFNIADYATRRAEELSKGNQQKIQFIAAVIHEPQVLLMDEPFVGLDPVNVALLKEAFLEMKRRGATIVFSTHQMEMVEELCESVVLIDRGRVVLGGSVREVRRSTGRQVIRLAVDGDTELAWLRDVPGRQGRPAGPGLRRARRRAVGRSGDGPPRGARSRPARDPIPDRRPLDRGHLHREGRPPADERSSTSPAWLPRGERASAA